MIRNMPVSKNNSKPFEWRLDKLDWSKETTHIDQCFEILRRVDFKIHKIEESRKFRRAVIDVSAFEDRWSM